MTDGQLSWCSVVRALRPHGASKRQAANKRYCSKCAAQINDSVAEWKGVKDVYKAAKLVCFLTQRLPAVVVSAVCASSSGSWSQHPHQSAGLLLYRPAAQRSYT